MPLKELPYAEGIVDLLRCLDDTSLLGLSTTASCNRLVAEDTNEAIDIVLRYTDSVARLFSYRRLNAQLLFDYLHKTDVPVQGTDRKAQLIDKIKTYWETHFTKERKEENKFPEATQIKETQRQFTDPVTQSTAPQTPQTNLKIQTPTPEVHIRVEIHQNISNKGVRSDTFAVEFCRWFYDLLNRLHPQTRDTPGDILTPEVFLSNSHIEVFFIGKSNCTENRADGQEETYQLLTKVCMEYQLNFVPNLETGIQALRSQHGLLRVLCCGVLHSRNCLAGVFEQEFGLVKCPLGTWKVALLKVNLRQASRTSLPQLPKGEVFEIEA